MAADGDGAPQGGSIETALQQVLKTALIHDGLARGLRESVKALDKRQAMLCVLAENCGEEAYKRLIVALCKEHSILILYVSDQMKLGEWVGLCKIDKTGTARKVVKCSCAVIKDIGEETEAWSTVLEYVKTKAASA